MYYYRMIPARGKLLAAPNTNWPGLRDEPDAGLTMVPTKSILGVAGLGIAKRVTPGIFLVGL